jgi:hypothetical protein
VSVHLALYVPEAKTRNVKSNPVSRRVKIPHQHLGSCHGLAAAVAGLPVARAAPEAWGLVVGQATGGELFLNQ